MVKKLVLMAPAVDFPERYVAAAGEPATLAWQHGETVPMEHHAYKKIVHVAGDLWRDCANWPSSIAPPCPTLAIAGRRDAVIPLPAIERWVAGQRGVRFHTVDDGHELNDSLETIWRLAEAFLGELG